MQDTRVYPCGMITRFGGYKDGNIQDLPGSPGRWSSGSSGIIRKMVFRIFRDPQEDGLQDLPGSPGRWSSGSSSRKDHGRMVPEGPWEDGP